jgi:hypothetical protein
MLPSLCFFCWHIAFSRCFVSSFPLLTFYLQEGNNDEEAKGGACFLTPPPIFFNFVSLTPGCHHSRSSIIPAAALMLTEIPPWRSKEVGLGDALGLGLRIAVVTFSLKDIG